MNPFTLHMEERRGFSRWMLAGVIILAGHAAIVASIALWYGRRLPAPHIQSAIVVTLAPVEASSPTIQNQDVAVGPTMQEAEQQVKEPPKVTDKRVEEIIEPPPSQPLAAVTLPSEQKEVEKPKADTPPPAPETRAPPPTQHVGPFTQAGSNSYNALILGHLQRFKRYPRSAQGAVGTVTVRFVLDRAGQVIKTEVTKSSGNSVLDAEAVSILHRASPFPPFPAAKPGADDFWIAPIKFDRD
jgi:periplasmic protein TonB